MRFQLPAAFLVTFFAAAIANAAALPLQSRETGAEDSSNEWLFGNMCDEAVHVFVDKRCKVPVQQMDPKSCPKAAFHRDCVQCLRNMTPSGRPTQDMADLCRDLTLTDYAKFLQTPTHGPQ